MSSNYPFVESRIPRYRMDAVALARYMDKMDKLDAIYDPRPDHWWCDQCSVIVKQVRCPHCGKSQEEDTWYAYSWF